MDKQERCKEGFEIYVNSMAKSANDKSAKIIPILREALTKRKGNILDLGAGGGELTKSLLSLAEEFKVKIFAVDRDPRMISILKEKFGGQKNVKVVQTAAENLKLKRGFALLERHGFLTGFGAVVCSSILHEVFSERKNIEDVRLVLKNIYNCLLPNGILAIRDGIKPPSETDRVLIQPLKSELFERFQKIINRMEAPWLKIHDYLNPRRTRLFLALSKENAYELAVKYQYPEINWPVEMKEKFGFWTKEKAKSILEETGFEIIQLESYLLPYFTQMFSKDFKLFEWKDGPGAIEIPYFDTHLIIAAQKKPN